MGSCLFTLRYITGYLILTIETDWLERAMYVFLLNHAKAVMSAAVRLSVVGPYQAQTILAASSTRKLLRDLLDEVRDLDVEDAGQTWALLDVYQGRQEILYSRVFNG
jgi:urease accessory protein